MSGNLSGHKLEICLSKSFHHEFCLPLLVSQNLLRRRNLGQIDLARLIKDKNEWLLEIGEVKSSTTGQQQMERLQKLRLYSTQSFLGAIFGYHSRLIVLSQGTEHTE